MTALSHITLGTNDVPRAANFYDEVLGVLGFTRVPKPPEKPLSYRKGEELPVIFIYLPVDERPATWGNGTHIAFNAESRQMVRDFYTAALRLGGMDEGAPGLRPHYGPTYYASYVRDPDGNKLQAVCFAESE